MSTMKSVLVVVATLLLGAPAAVQACSCAVMDVPTARRAAAMVFEGTILRIESPASSGVAQATFRVERVWKGTVAREVTIRVPAQPSMCPPHFEQGQTYIVYAASSDQGPRVGSCARHAVASQLAAERNALGAPERTYPRHMVAPPS